MCCELSQPGVAVEWKKGAVLLSPGNKYEMKQDGCELQLQINDLTSQDSGAYRCCADGIETRASITVKGNTKIIACLYISFDGEDLIYA